MRSPAVFRKALLGFSLIYRYFCSLLGEPFWPEPLVAFGVAFCDGESFSLEPWPVVDGPCDCAFGHCVVMLTPSACSVC